MNIIESCCEQMQCQQVIAFIGGMHLIDGHETESEIKVLAGLLQTKFPKMLLATGHCTGEKAINLLKVLFGNRFETFYSGWTRNF